MERKKKLIVFSADAMVWEDMEYFKELPNYKKYLEGGCMIERVDSVYPTTTYPCHTTMATGVWPDKHQVTGNGQFKPGVLPQPWRWDYSFVEWKEDIFSAAKKAGYTTASVFWPVTGNHPFIDYLIDEYWTQGPSDTPRQAWGRMGSSSEVLDIVERHIGGNEIRRHPDTERFIVDCTCDIIRRYGPDVIFLHPANIDGYRHETGLFNDKVLQGLHETDQWIGEIMKAVKDIGQLDNTNLVLTSDHGQMETKRVINPNVILADHGLIRKHGDGSLKDWDAWYASGGMSALVYLKNPKDRRIYEKTYKLLCDMMNEGIYGISQVLTECEAGACHLAGPFSFVLETDGYTSFGDEINRPLVQNHDSADYRYGKATHGYLPAKGPQPVFLAKGPDFNEKVIMKRGRLIDQAPTYAKLLGTALPNADGNAIESFIRKTQK